MFEISNSRCQNSDVMTNECYYHTVTGQYISQCDLIIYHIIYNNHIKSIPKSSPTLRQVFPCITFFVSDTVGKFDS